MQLIKNITLLFLAIASLNCNYVSAQTDPKADGILKKLSQKTEGNIGITAKFESRLQNLKDNLDVVQQGNIEIKGKNYKLNLDKYLIINNGTTIWNYNADDNEVNISDASEMEEDMNPSEIFTIYENGFKSKYEGSITENGKKLEVINLYPVDAKEKPFHTIILHINATTNDLHKVVMKYKDGNTITYSIKEIKYGVEFLANNFTFQLSKFPGVLENDLR